MFHDLETARLMLRSVGAEDREFLFEQFSDADVTRFLFDAEPYASVAEADELIAFYTAAEPRAQHRWILRLKGNDEKIGTCGFHRWDAAARRAEIGYDLMKAYQGRGYMTEALAAIIDFAEREMKLRRLDAHIYPENAASVALAERAGFVKQAVGVEYVFRGETYPHAVYSRFFPPVPYGYCGMTCALCSRHRASGVSACPGCSRDGYYTDTCKAYDCCVGKGSTHCALCAEYPCRRLGGMGDFRDLNTNNVKRRVCDSIRAEGFAAWYDSYKERAALLTRALDRYNDGRMKRFLCEMFIQRDMKELRDVMRRAEALVGDRKTLGKAFRSLAAEAKDD